MIDFPGKRSNWAIILYMVPILSIIAVLCAGGWLGITFVPFLSDRDPDFDGDGLELWGVTWFGGLMLLGWIALILTQLSLFSPVALILVLIGFGGIGLFLSRQSGQPLFGLRGRIRRLNWERPLKWENGLPNQAEYLLLALLFLCLSPLYFRPHEMIVGAHDVGIYINLATHIERTGGLYIENELLAQLDEALRPGLLRQMPEVDGGYNYWSSGLLVPDGDGRISPPFYHLQSVWQAMGLALGGLAAAFLMTPTWGLLSCLAIYFVIRRLVDPQPHSLWFVLITLIGFAICALQVWFSRYGTAEALTQFLFWCGLWGFIAWADTDYKSWVWALLAGTAWGMTFLARIDTFFILLIPGILVLMLVFMRRWENSLISFGAPLIVLPVHSVLHATRFADGYFASVFGYVGRVGLRYLPYLIVSGIVVLGLVWFISRYKGSGSWLIRLSQGMLFVSFALFYLYNRYLRPRIGTFESSINPWDNIRIEKWNHENLLRLEWYLSPIGVGLAFIGILFLIARLNRKNWPYLVLGLLFTFIYIWDSRINGIHIYSQRRYVPVVIPFFIVSGGLLLHAAAGWVSVSRRWLVHVVMLAWLVGLVLPSLQYSPQIDQQQVPDQLAEFSERFPSNSVLLFNQQTEISIGDFLTVPLFFLHEQNPFVFRHLDRVDPNDLATQIARWEDEGYQVYWLEQNPDPGHPWPFGEDGLTPEGAFLFETTQLEPVSDRRPEEILTILWQIEIFKVDGRQLQ